MIIFQSLWELLVNRPALIAEWKYHSKLHTNTHTHVTQQENALRASGDGEKDEEQESERFEI